jgi:hypothetical protein
MADTHLKHILIEGGGKAEAYVSPPGRGKQPRVPTRSRLGHGKKLLSDLELAWTRAREQREQAGVVGISGPAGIFLEFRSADGYDILLERLERRPSGIDLRAVRKIGDVTYATVFVPDGKLSVFERIVSDYLNKDSASGKPKNKPLVDSVEEINLAALRSFWTDASALFPEEGMPAWWEVWLRDGGDAAERFVAWAQKSDLHVEAERITFPERVVVMVRGTAEKLSASIEMLDVVAEVRLGRKTPATILRQPRHTQQALVDGIVRRLEAPGVEAPAVCLLDTGVTQGHPLITQMLEQADMHACHPAWGSHDDHGHGTEMAGVALYGDLLAAASSTGPVAMKHRLESVKILPPDGANDPKLYGALTIEAVARAEVAAPDRDRASCLAVTEDSYDRRGLPTSWSAAIDKLASGADDDQRRLVVVSGGNTVRAARHLYPANNLTETVQDPAHAWNAVTVGAFTEKVAITDSMFQGWASLAPPGGLGPSSSTSRVWIESWPAKPDVVAEGGNMARAPDGKSVDYADELQLLTTNFQPLVRPFTVTGDTSAAAAAVARMGAIIFAHYPRLWPETVRALIVHSADWTTRMRDQFAPMGARSELGGLLRTCGFGVPNLDAALWSAGNSLTLLVQDEVQPFDGDKTKDMKVHALPWPNEILADLGETDVELRVTLSYFVEPNPAERGWQRKFRYMSHGLRFDVKTPEESESEFRKRLNRAARDEEEKGTQSASDAKEWLLGPTLRHKGSIHSDRWEGSAVKLAKRGLIGIYPVMGWWRERHHLGRSRRRARYALVVTIRTPRVDVDVYTAVRNKLAIAIPTRGR